MPRKGAASIGLSRSLTLNSFDATNGDREI